MATQDLVLKANDLVLRPPQTDTMLTVIERMVMSPEFDVNKLAHVLELREKEEQRKAKRAFVEAMNVFKLNPPTIVKNHQVSFNSTSYKHATLDSIVRAVTETLSAVGISHRWVMKQDGTITVTCILTHKDGHSEETTLTAPADNSGSKNSIQAIGSTVTYLQRYTLMAACGLAAGEDDDGRGATPQVQKPHLAEERIAELCEWLANASSKEELHKFWEMSKGEAKAAMSGPAMNRFTAAKNKRKEELGL